MQELPPERPRFPLETRPIAVLFLHGGCAMRCPFCISDPGLQSMTPELLATALDLVARRGFTEVVLGGGEPCEWPWDWRNAAREAKSRGFLVQLGTNGRLLGRNFACFDAVDRYVLPLDGASGEAHNRMRAGDIPDDGGNGGHHALIWRRLEQLRRAGREVTVSTVLTADNVEEVPGIGGQLGDYAAAGGRLHAWHLYRFLPMGRGGGKNAERLALAHGAYEAAVAMARRTAPGLRIYKRPDMRHSATVDFFWRQDGKIIAGSEAWADEVPQPLADEA